MLDVMDVGLTKWSSLFFGVLIGAYFADLVLTYWMVIIALAFILAIRTLYRSLK